MTAARPPDRHRVGAEPHGIDPRTITPSLDLLFIAKSIERIGDHAKNLAECVIYIVNGLDVRHIPIDTIESKLG